MKTQNLTRAQKISATKKEKFASLSDLEKLHKRIQRNPHLLDLCSEIDKILATLSLLANKSSKNKSIQSEIDDWNQTHPQNIIQFNETYSSLKIQYSAGELKEKFGKDGYQLWRSFFKQIGKGGKDKNGNSFVSSWSINLTIYDQVQKEIKTFLQKHKLKKISDRNLAFIHVMTHMDVESLEFTELEVVLVDNIDLKVCGKKDSKKIIGSIERSVMKKQRKQLKEEIKNIEETNKLRKVKTVRSTEFFNKIIGEK